MKQEIYKWIPGYEGLYKVSNYGNVLSFHKSEDGQPITVCKANTGYMFFNARKNKKSKSIKIHRVICELFHGQPPAKDSQVNHVDGEKSNNHYLNLEWSSSSENQKHARKIGLNKRTEFKQKAVTQKTLNGELVKIYPSFKSAIKENELSAVGLNHACNKKLKTYKGYIWDYAEVNAQ